MSEFSGLLCGGAPVIRKFQINASVSYIGIPLCAPGAGNAGLALGTTTGAADMVGMNIDLPIGTYQTAQQTDNSDPERTISVIINPDAVWRARLSGGATDGTALSTYAVTTASTDGLVVTTASEWSNPTYDEGSVWCYSGANAGKVRKITSVSSTAATVTIAFPYDTVVGDKFCRAPFWPFQGATAQFTTNLYEVDATIAVGTGAAMRCIGLDVADIGGEGLTKSFVLLVSNDHIFNVAT